MRRLRIIIISMALVFFVLIAAVKASIFGEENCVLSAILTEDIQHTFRLAEMVKVASNQLSKLNEQYGFDHWINKGLDEVKDYGFLEELKIDDFVLGTFQKDMGEVGMGFGGKLYNLNNIDDWVDQIWDSQPEIIHSKADLRSAVVHGSAVRAYEHYLSNVERDKAIREEFPEMMDDASTANPGIAARISAQANVIQTAQLADLHDTQSDILRLMALREMERQHENNQKRISLKQGFVGVVNLMSSVPTLGK